MKSFPRTVIRFPASDGDSCDTATGAVVLLPLFFEPGWLQPPAKLVTAIKKNAADASPFER